MVLIRNNNVDLCERISREIEFQVKRGRKPTYLEISPEAHEAMRILMHAPLGTTLSMHDGVPVSINRKFIGPTAYVLHLEGGAAPTEIQLDRARSSGRPVPSLVIATH